jgi:hypothetical protein
MGASCKTPGASDHKRICSPLWAIFRLIDSTSGAYSDPNHHFFLVAAMRFPVRPFLAAPTHVFWRFL